MKTSMNRRDFLRLAGAAGLAVIARPGLGRADDADVEATGPYWIFIHADGGWDPTSLCDPKGRRDEMEEAPVNMYFTDDIEEAGNIRYAPVAGHREFFQKHYRRVLVVNGVDTQTNNHDAGTRYTWSGRLSEGYPALAALIAGVLSPGQPMAFITNGGYDLTDGLVAPTRTGNIGAIHKIAFPNSIDGNPQGEKFHTDATFQRIQAALSRRQPLLEQEFDLPKAKHAIGQLYTARSGRNQVQRLSEYLPERFEDASLKRQGQVALAAFRAGIARTANLTIGGFDTHGDHDNQHYPRLAALLQGVDFIWEEAERQQVADDLVVVVGSDFGRTPGYNAGNGKDHWSITSVLLMGKGIPGNRVVGTTDEHHVPIEVDPDTLRAAPGTGIRIRPGHVHAALRQLAGIDDADVVQNRFPLSDVEPIPLLKG
jgi:hypothetical protein